MPRISGATVIVAYDIGDDDTRSAVQEYLEDTVGATQRTESVYEFRYSPPVTPEFGRIVRRLRKIISPSVGDRLYVWDLEAGSLRRLAVHAIQ